MTKDEVIKTLNLEPLSIEGGYFRQVYKSALNIPKSALPGEYKAASYTASTSIYYLLGPEDASSLHALSADETWHFYASAKPGTRILLLVLHPCGKSETVMLGPNLACGELPQFTVPAGCAFGGKMLSSDPESDWCLTGATVAPSFEYADFTKCDAEEYAARFPEHAELIRQIG